MLGTSHPAITCHPERGEGSPYGEDRGDAE